MGGDEEDAGLLASMGIPQQHWDQMRGESTLSIWPENWSALNVFADMQTQWRIGMAGPTGLDYQAMSFVMDIRAVEDRAECFSGIRVMENEALTIFRRKNG